VVDQARQAAAHVTAEAEARAARLVAQAEQAEAAEAERQRQHRYLVKVEENRAALARAVADYERCKSDVAATTERAAEMATRAADAEQRIAAARAVLEVLAASDDASLDALEAARLRLATSESLPGLVAPKVAAANTARREAAKALEAATEQIRKTWAMLEHLQALGGVERPEVVPSPEEKRRAEWADLARRIAIVEQYRATHGLDGLGRPIAARPLL
jgi:hypothetical protein